VVGIDLDIEEVGIVAVFHVDWSGWTEIVVVRKIVTWDQVWSVVAFQRIEFDREDQKIWVGVAVDKRSALKQSRLDSSMKMRSYGKRVVVVEEQIQLERHGAKVSSVSGSGCNINKEPA
jgi:hypothetical protein